MREKGVPGIEKSIAMALRNEHAWLVRSNEQDSAANTMRSKDPLEMPLPSCRILRDMVRI